MNRHTVQCKSPPQNIIETLVQSRYVNAQQKYFGVYLPEPVLVKELPKEKPAVDLLQLWKHVTPSSHLYEHVNSIPSFLLRTGYHEVNSRIYSKAGNSKLG